MMRRFCFMAGVLLFGAVFFFCRQSNSMADSTTNDSIRAKEQEIASAKETRENLQSGLTDIQSLKKELENTKASLDQYVTKLDANMLAIETKIAELMQLISDKETEIAETEAELQEAIVVQTEQYEAMKIRIKFMYEQGNTYYMEMLFRSESFGDMLNKADFIEELSEYDRNKLQEYITYSEYVALCKEALEEEKIVLDEAKLVVEEEQAAVEELILEKENQINVVMGDIADKNKAIQEYEAEIAAMSAVIQATEKALAEERARLAESQRRRYDGGMFAMPAPSYKRVSEEYGDRIHPILKTPQFHNGVDFAAPSGTPILAAYDGKVIAAEWNSTMGNYVMIDHGDGVITIYMHASSLGVSKGAEVTKGQTIAAVGSTGRSTGPHLHFSVRVNGSYVSPWNYIK